MEFYLSAIMLGLCLSAMSLGIFITMKIFNMPDITTDGSYTLGGVVTAIIIGRHLPAAVAVPAVLAAGALAGVLTGLVHTRLKIDALLAGIIVMTGLYSINLMLLGRSNVPLIGVTTIYTWLPMFATQSYNELIVAIVLITILVCKLSYLLATDFGIAMRATGNSPTMTKAMGINNNTMKITGLALANAATAFSGYLVCQYQGFTDINMGIGIVITGLGTVLIGDTLVKWLKVRKTTAQLGLVVLGSIIFQLVLAFTLSMGVDPNMLKLVTAVFVLVIVYLPTLKLSR